MALRFAGKRPVPCRSVLRLQENERRPGAGESAFDVLRMNKLIEHAAARHDGDRAGRASRLKVASRKPSRGTSQSMAAGGPAPVPGGRSPGGTHTVGGLIATNSLGPLRLGCGDWRLFILGMRWIDAAGRIIKGGGRTMKNVAGYNTPRMMIGSCGSLGAIAEVTLRTFIRPEDEQCALFYCPSAAQAETLFSQIMISPTTPAYVQLIGGRTFANNPLQLPAMTTGESGMLVAIGFLGRP